MENLAIIPVLERRHFLKCAICNEYFDCRNLSQVFDHIHENLPQPQFESSRRKEESNEYLRGNIEIIQN
jgi:hypothetical protein